MKKAILLCSGGMSTTIIMNKLNEVNDMGITFTASGITGTNWQGLIDENDIILVSPQIRFQFNEIKEVCDAKGKFVMAIPPLMYSPIRAPQLWAQVKEGLEKK